MAWSFLNRTILRRLDAGLPFIPRAYATGNSAGGLEESLWRSETRFDYEYMDKVLAPDFFEFGRSGRTYKREETLSGSRPQTINIKFPLKNFSIALIDTNVALVTYISEVMYEKMEVANRSSIWLKNATGWQIKFHQGTPTTV